MLERKFITINGEVCNAQTLALGMESFMFDKLNDVVARDEILEAMQNDFSCNSHRIAEIYQKAIMDKNPKLPQWLDFDEETAVSRFLVSDADSYTDEFNELRKYVKAHGDDPEWRKIDNDLDKIDALVFKKADRNILMQAQGCAIDYWKDVDGIRGPKTNSASAVGHFVTSEDTLPENCLPDRDSVFYQCNQPFVDNNGQHHKMAAYMRAAEDEHGRQTLTADFVMFDEEVTADKNRGYVTYVRPSLVMTKDLPARDNSVESAKELARHFTEAIRHGKERIAKKVAERPLIPTNYEADYYHPEKGLGED